MEAYLMDKGLFYVGYDCYVFFREGQLDAYKVGWFSSVSMWVSNIKRNISLIRPPYLAPIPGIADWSCSDV